MNPQDSRHPWSRLTAGARQVPDARDETAPYGFATRIAALALAQERRVVSAFDRLAYRALGVAFLLAVGSVAINYRSIAQPIARPHVVEEEIQFTPVEDPVAVLLDA